MKLKGQRTIFVGRKEYILQFRCDGKCYILYTVYCILPFLDGKFVFVIFIMRFALSWKLSGAFLLLDISTYFFSFALKKRILLDPLQRAIFRK